MNPILYAICTTEPRTVTLSVIHSDDRDPAPEKRWELIEQHSDKQARIIRYFRTESSARHKFITRLASLMEVKMGGAV